VAAPGAAAARAVGRGRRAHRLHQHPAARSPDQPISSPAPLDTPIEVGAEEPTPFGRRAGDTQPCLLVAEHQTRGRGRQGRSWQGSAGASLTFSLALPLDPPEWSGLSLAVGVALADAIDPGGARVGLKWPNDLWLLEAPGAGRKLGGVLIETVAVGNRRMAVIGVGLNVAPQPVRDVSAGYACWQEIDPTIDAPAALHRVAEPLVRELLRFEREGFPGFIERYAARDLLRGRRVTTTHPDASHGVVEGVGLDGALCVRAGEALHMLTSAEVSVHPEA
jgi:BirA family biotin operon repressor/biotin-[acetyl-CoA-carboxylase] ligase